MPFYSCVEVHDARKCPEKRNWKIACRNVGLINFWGPVQPNSSLIQSYLQLDSTQACNLPVKLNTALCDWAVAVPEWSWGCCSNPSFRRSTPSFGWEKNRPCDWVLYFDKMRDQQGYRPSDRRAETHAGRWQKDEADEHETATLRWTLCVVRGCSAVILTTGARAMQTQSWTGLGPSIGRVGLRID